MSDQGSPLFLLLLLGGVGLFAVVAVLGWLQASRRREAMFAFATQRGWNYLPDDDSLVDRWAGTPFGVGKSRHARNVIQGTWRGRSFVCFDYSYVTETGSGDNRSETTHHYGVLATDVPAYLPRVEVAPESWGTRLVSGIGLNRDLDLESHDFNQAFRVDASDPRVATAILTPRLMEQLLARPRHAWRLAGPSLVTWELDEFTPGDIQERLDHTTLVLSAVPTFVWRDHGWPPPVPGEPGGPSF
jgi:hypothetical protein